MPVQEQLRKKIGCLVLSLVGFILFVLALVNVLPLWLQIGLFGIFMLITLLLPPQGLFSSDNRGEITGLPRLFNLANDDTLEEEEDMELKGEILHTLFPGVLVDEESPVLKKKEDEEVGSDPSCGVDGENDEGVTCAICLEPFASGDLVVTGASCSHVFHQPCILQWMLKKRRRRSSDEHNSCPTCRSPMWTDEDYEKAETAVTAARASNEEDQKVEAADPRENADAAESPVDGNRHSSTTSTDTAEQREDAAGDEPSLEQGEDDAEESRLDEHGPNSTTSTDTP
uniref:RING-type domain-containing protein n=1 Tax=Grammatophora oceanica TaxID=210454 RepID=A0A7S1VKQ7_9STRA|mmetsp:Transcript_49276/g.73495  ORF Transcript_49276/g.73495 Transcript_49276/m.73495 type:complete len:285 (+) Transcript_49276:125-979(+)|eukprot:CAMPEP_0194028288 /NCGR_PEP_ID=MMETSP0009_2-20130614/2301_1 /TAXON_ID=210454 /ORGANISM="Grammatophora oceanica, Strain CCMP 410" /LENGTH=284 /DNA_ID=CAMNT_0038667633 /DNA_START=59 /DNA_END=913 /DNA_ORIENTATION=-